MDDDLSGNTVDPLLDLGCVSNNVVGVAKEFNLVLDPDCRAVEFEEKLGFLPGKSGAAASPEPVRRGRRAAVLGTNLLPDLFTNDILAQIKRIDTEKGIKRKRKKITKPKIK